MSRLKAISPNGPVDADKKKIEKENDRLVSQLTELTKKLHAEGKQSLLLILQGMSASGKDGLVRTLFQKTSPAWVQVRGFKKPSEEEYAHDFLWRINKALPKKGTVMVFNRSHYEDILVPTVYDLFPKNVVEKRYNQINNFEKHLEENGVKVVKVYLHITPQKQAVRLRERINNPEKHWKHADHDWEEKDKWKEFMAVYERLFDKCDEVPWNIVPANKNYIKINTVGKLVVQALKKMNPKYPPLDSEKFVPNYEKAKETFLGE